MTASARGLVLAFRLAPHVPESLVRCAMAVAADVAWALRTKGVRRLESNLAKVTGLDAGSRSLRALSHQGMRNYMRYFAETLTLAGLTHEQIDARVRPVHMEDVEPHVADGGAAVLALGHQGNWDLAGAWATRNIAHVTTIAERLEPPEVFEAFLSLREEGGLSILPLDSGSTAFAGMVKAARQGPALLPLLADRDLTSHGIEVTLCGHRARVAAGPAALAVATGSPLFATTIRHERLTGQRRRAAGSRWGIVLAFHRVEIPPDLPREDRVPALTQAWVDVLGADVIEHPAHWHMLQRVFVDDLDPAHELRGESAS
jgi:phosphatidylinositol dimannoside acyltransferase